MLHTIRFMLINISTSHHSLLTTEDINVFLYNLLDKSNWYTGEIDESKFQLRRNGLREPMILGIPAGIKGSYFRQGNYTKVEMTVSTTFIADTIIIIPLIVVAVWLFSGVWTEMNALFNLLVIYCITFYSLIAIGLYKIHNYFHRKLHLR